MKSGTRYENVSVNIWSDADFEDCDNPDVLLLYLYLITNPYGHGLTGIGRMPALRTLKFDTRLTDERYTAALAVLVEKHKIVVDDGWLWIVGKSKHSVHGPKQAQGAVNLLRDYPDTVRIPYLRKYGKLLRKNDIPQSVIDTLSLSSTPCGVNTSAAAPGATPMRYTDLASDAVTVAETDTGSVPEKACAQSDPKTDRPAPAPEIPEELRGLELYETDEKLCKAWPGCFPGWRKAYPGVDVAAEVRKAHAWEMANPSRRKVLRTRFLNSWLARAQDAQRGARNDTRPGAHRGGTGRGFDQDAEQGGASKFDELEKLVADGDPRFRADDGGAGRSAHVPGRGAG